MGHLSGSEFDASFIGFGGEFNNGFGTFIDEGMGKGKNSFKRIKKRAIPMLFKRTPNALNGIVFAVVRRIISKFDNKVERINKSRNPFHKLSSATVAFGTIILIKNKSCDMRKAVFVVLPEVSETINDKVTGDFRGGKIEK